MRPNRLTATQKTEVCRIYLAAEQSGRAIAKLLGVSPSTVRAALQEAGITMDKKSHFLSVSRLGAPPAMKGQKRTAESIEKQKVSRRLNAKPVRAGYKHSDETRRRISAATKGKNVKYTDEERRRIQQLRSACKRFLRRVLRRTGAAKTGSTEIMLGFGRVELAAHLGPIPDGHEIDHIVPVAEFFRRGIVDPAVINALPNLQVLHGELNKRKSDTLPLGVEQLITGCTEWAASRKRSEP